MLLAMDFLMYSLGITYLLCSVRISEAKFFVLPSNWSSINNSSLPSYNTVQGPFRAVADGEGNPIASDDWTFGLGFINVNSSGAYTLSVVMGFNLSSLPGMEIWTANRNKTVGENAVVRVGSDGDLILEDADGSVACRFAGTGNAKAIEILNKGNFQIYNTTNSSLAASKSSDVVWQSWDHPTHTLLPGQTLKTGNTLVSNASQGSASDGSYSLVMHPGGMVLLFTDSNGIAEPYWYWGLQGLDYQGVLKPCFYNYNSTGSEAYYDGQRLQISYNGTIHNSSASCSATQTASRSFGPSTNDTEYTFLRLDDDGNVRVYRVGSIPGSDNNVTFWSKVYELFPSDDDCSLPKVCGPYGMCTRGQCSCPSSETRDYFQVITNLDPSQGCVSSLALQCDASNPSKGHSFLVAFGFDYFPNDFLQPERNVSTADECKTLCSSNCSCTAAFFRSGSASCYLAGDPLWSLKAAPNETYQALIKVQIGRPLNHSSTNGFSLNAGSIAGIAVGSAAALLFLCLIVVIAYVQHRRKKESQMAEAEDEEMDPEELEEEAFLKTLPGLPPRFSYRELQDATGGFGKRLGTGGFGSVYEGRLPDNSRVAVKKLDGGMRQGYKEFRAEVATIGSISHVNLVRLRGFCADSRQRLLVYELLENGSLDKWLFPPKGGCREPEESRFESPCLTWQQRYNVAVGTARGLAYLHEECRESIMHLDIKPQNILLDKNFSPKVSDFGMSKLLNEDMTQIVTAVRGTPGYLAPEWLRHSVATKKCDVYSFGMVLLELVSGRRNFDPAASDPRLCYFPAWAMLRALEGRYMELVDRRLGDDVDTDGVMRMTKVAFWCIQDDPNKRPWMSVALKMLEGEWDIPDAPLWLLQRGPEFLEGYGYERMNPMELVMRIGNSPGYESIPTISANDISGPR